MNWYYADGSQQVGPLTEAGFQDLVNSGKITPETLVWKEGMANWTPYREVRGGGATAGAVPAAMSGVVCAECGGTFPPDEVIRYGTASVCANCKPIFVQRLKEGTAMQGALEYAGFGTRLVAKIVDGIILWVLNMAIGFVAGFAMASGGGGEGEALAAQLVLGAISIVINIGYGIFFLGKFGATPGKMACKIKVVTPEGSPITYGRATGRCFAEILSGIILYIGYIMAAFDEEKRTLHDRIAGTRVVKR